MSSNLLKRPARLVDDMAAARGLDLQELAMRGDLDLSDISDLVLRCAGCTQADACERWLAEQVGAVSATPQFCRNAEGFAALARRSG